MCVVVYYYSDIKICGEGGGAGERAADQRGAGGAAAARHLGLQRADSKICSTDWNRLRVCRSALVETWPMLGLNLNIRPTTSFGTQKKIFKSKSHFSFKFFSNNIIFALIYL